MLQRIKLLDIFIVLHSSLINLSNSEVAKRQLDPKSPVSDDHQINFYCVLYAWTVPVLIMCLSDAEAEGPIFWPLDAKSQLIGKDPDTGKD